MSHVHKPPRQFAAGARVRRRPRLGQPVPGAAPEPAALDPAYWQGLGCEVEPVVGLLLVTLPSGTVIEDRGDQMLFRSLPTLGGIHDHLVHNLAGRRALHDIAKEPLDPIYDLLKPVPNGGAWGL